MQRITHITIIGGGNVAHHLKKGLENHFKVSQVNSRKIEIRELSQLYLIAVADDAISQVAESLLKAFNKININQDDILVAHTSGTTPRIKLKPFFKNYAVFYPLQTFTKTRDLNYSAIPIFIDAENNKQREILKEVANTVFNCAIEANSEMLQKLHIAAVFSCNFVNHLWSLSNDYLTRYEIDFKLLYPLLRETLEKIENMSPREAQTGPARRKDLATINTHLSQLQEEQDIKSIYEFLTSSIIKMYEQDIL